eukprot:342852_1
MGSKLSKKKKRNSANEHETIVKLADPAPIPQNLPSTSIQQPQTTELKTPIIEDEIKLYKEVTKIDENNNNNIYKPESYTPQPGFNNKILLYGFMRDIEKGLQGESAMQIIPDTIMQLCDSYYSTPNIIFYFEMFGGGNSLYIVDLDDMDRKLTKNHTLNYNNILPSPLDPNSIHASGMYYKSKIKLPYVIMNQLSDKCKQNTNENSYFDAIFKCGGTKVSVTAATDFCCGYIWNYQDKYFENICQVTLPNYINTDSVGQTLIWSDKRQCLYSIARNTMNVLSFNDDISDNWKWETQSNNLINSFGINRKRIGFMSSVIVRNDMNEERLISVGGGNGDTNSGTGVKYCDLYDIDNDKWIKLSDMNFARHRTGIYHDKWTQRIYIGGGNGAERKIEFYDLNKNKWYFDKKMMPYTTMKHNVYPIIWNQDGHLLYIASVKANGVEFIDLRQDNKKWNVVYDKLDPLFSTNIVWYNATNCRLIQ